MVKVINDKFKEMAQYLLENGKTDFYAIFFELDEYREDFELKIVNAPKSGDGFNYVIEIRPKKN